MQTSCILLNLWFNKYRSISRSFLLSPQHKITRIKVTITWCLGKRWSTVANANGRGAHLHFVWARVDCIVYVSPSNGSPHTKVTLIKIALTPHYHYDANKKSRNTIFKWDIFSLEKKFAHRRSVYCQWLPLQQTCTQPFPLKSIMHEHFKYETWVTITLRCRKHFNGFFSGSNNSCTE